MHLADTAFTQVKCDADFLHRHLLVVVEDDDEALGAGEALGHQVLEVLALQEPQRVDLGLVGDHVDLADLAGAVRRVGLAGDAGDGRGFDSVQVLVLKMWIVMVI